VNLDRAVPVGCVFRWCPSLSQSASGSCQRLRAPALLCQVETLFPVVRALVHHGRNSLHSHSFPLSRPPLPQSAVSLPTVAAAATACAGVADVHPAFRSRLSLGATAIAAAHAPVRRSDAPGTAERMELLQQGIPRSALDRFWQGRHSQARLESAGRQQGATSRPAR